MSFVDDLLGGLAGAGLGFVSGGPVGALAGGIGGFASAAGAGEQRGWSADQAQKQMDFQERMSSTAWQRGVADMRKAGINPMLAFQQGGASSPVGSMASGGESPLSAGVSSALSAMTARQQLANLHQDELSKLQDNLIKAKQLKTGPGAPRDAEGNAMSYAEWTAYMNNLLTSAQASSAQSLALKARTSAALDRAALPGAGVSGSKLGGWVDVITKALGGVSSASRAAMPMFAPVP